eukprot:gene12584-12715_t
MKITNDDGSGFRNGLPSVIKSRKLLQSRDKWSWRRIWKYLEADGVGRKNYTSPIKVEEVPSPGGLMTTSP